MVRWRRHGCTVLIPLASGTLRRHLWYNLRMMNADAERWRITHFAETASTNLLAKEGRPGDVFTADYQSAGRGRLDHRWISPPGENLMMSAVVDVAGMDPQEAATLPLAVGQWQAKCYVNAEIVGVQLVEGKGVRDGR